METTLVIDDVIMSRLSEEAARQGRTPSELVEAALRAMLPKPEVEHQELPPLPSYHCGKPLVDVANAPLFVPDAGPQNAMLSCNYRGLPR